MLENITQWFSDGGAYLVTGLTAFVGAIPIIKSVVSTMTKMKETLPASVTKAVDDKMLDLSTKIDSVKTSSDSFKLQETILNCKSKLSSSVLSPELKEEYHNLMYKAQTELKEVYGVVVEIPANV